MSVACLAFTEKGFLLAQTLARELDGTAERSGRPYTLQQWTQQHFLQERALIYVGAVGIAVRAIAPYLQSKAVDPAVVVVDECARFAIPILSGHLGGANDLARKVAKICGAMPVITTATDTNGIFAVDEWARRQNCAVLHTACIRKISGALLASEKVRIRTEIPVCGNPPSGIEVAEQDPCDVYVGFTPQPESVLWLVPKVVVLGVGCRKGISAEMLEQAWERLAIPEQAVCQIASIDLKAAEPGLQEFCRHHSWELETYSAVQLAQVEGEFSASTFVKQVTGVDNVCERAAILASEGTLLHRKMAGGGVTLAAAVRPYRLDWRFHNEW